MKLRLRRKKKKQPQTLDENLVRQIMKDELALHDTETDNKKLKDKEREAKLSRIRSMPRSKKNQLLRYMERRKK